MVYFGIFDVEREIFEVKKRVAIFLYSFGPGGAERVASILLNYFKDDYQLTLILMNDYIFYPIPKSVEVIFLEKSKPFEAGIKKLLKLPYLAYRLKKIATEKEFDLIFSFMNRPNYISILAKIFGLKVPIIISERGTPSSFYSGDGLYDRVSKILIKLLYKRADIVTTNSYGAKEDLIENFNISKDKIEVLYNPYNIDKIIEKSEEVTIQKPKNLRVWLSVGRFDSKKNHKAVIEAFKEIKDERDRLWIVGEGVEQEEIKEFIKLQKLEDSVRLFGRVDNPFSIMANSDFFVSASKTEGFPNVLVEALACSLPIIATDCKSGPREILANINSYHKTIDYPYYGEYGILVSVNNLNHLIDTMRDIKTNQQIATSYREKAKKRAYQFNIDKTLPKFKNLIERYI